MPKPVSGILARVLLPTFPEMREWEKPPPKSKRKKKQQPLTRAPARCQTKE